MQTGLQFTRRFQNVLPRVVELVEINGYTQQQAAEILNSENHFSPDGKPLKFQQVTVCRILKVARSMSKAKQVTEERTKPKSWDEMTLEERLFVAQAEERELQELGDKIAREERQRYLEVQNSLQRQTI